MMDVDNNQPIEITRLLYPNINDLNKKRKFEDQQLGLPTLKHKFRSSGSRHEFLFADDPETGEANCVLMINEKSKVEAIGNRSEMESGEDSNSFVEESDSPTSAYAEFEPDYAQTYTHDQPYTSTDSCTSNNFRNTLYSLDSRAIKKTSANKEQLTLTHGGPNPLSLEGKLQFEPESQRPEELLGFGKYSGYICSIDRNKGVEQYPDEEHEDMHTYVLSSGRSTNKDAQLASTKPTIDQEFEQYFATLML